MNNTDEKLSSKVLEEYIEEKSPKKLDNSFDKESPRKLEVSIENESTKKLEDSIKNVSPTVKVKPFFGKPKNIKMSVSEYNPTKTNYHPINDAFWSNGKP